MTDIVDAATRSRMMSGIRGKNTKPEILIRKGLFALGFRYRLHDSRLAGKPDMVFPRYKAVLFVQGCFWHGHDCPLFKMPKTREEFWKNKIEGNRERDAIQHRALLESGWRIALVWECALKSSNSNNIRICNQISEWITSTNPELEIRA